ncbi:unnamed protein product [Euphydryas editha]|uniref:Transposase n=1 Tax=Euphydryas editha TaxID=104508 RepID=A0AAU9ULH5_EUPED|nr:unnamed protein product [Euphydryas editha]
MLYIGEAYMKAASSQNAVKGFSTTGIWPTNSNVFNDSDYMPSTVTDGLVCLFSNFDTYGDQQSFDVNRSLMPTEKQEHTVKSTSMMQKCNQVFSYKQWVSTPKVTLETTIKSTLDFVDDFCEKLVALLPHNFIAKEQAAYLRALKESITENEFMVIVDFAENYAFVVQDAAPGFHWNNDQATVYTVVIYYKVDNQFTHQSMINQCIISDCLNHDSIAVHIYSEIIINFIKSLSSTVAKLFFFSDGAPQQYKNYKHFSNLSHYRREFGVIVEWNFFATAHGKGPCDGVGGTIKRKASRTSLQLPPDQQILTPKQLFEWASQNLTKMNIRFSTIEVYNSMKEKLEDQFTNAKTIPATQKIHKISPLEDCMVQVKMFSSSEKYLNHSTMKKRRESSSKKR